ncbi:MAG: HD domain-containing protein [Candidatus Asgardarchaeum sp.]
MCDLEKYLDKIMFFSKAIMGKSFHHGWPHVERVLNVAHKISQKEGGHYPIIKAAVFLHDIGRYVERSLNSHHAVLSADIAKEFLKSIGVCDYHISEITHIIISHSFTSGIKPRSLEAKIVSDADKIDALGAVGVIRAFLFGESNGRSPNDTLQHFIDKLFKLPDLMYTNTGKIIARKRVKIMKVVYEELLNELSIK